MAILQGLEVTIKSGGEALKEYDDPEDDAEVGSNEVTKYIEVVPGSQFSICVRAGPTFTYNGGNALQVSRTLDGLEGTTCKYVANYELTRNNECVYEYEIFCDSDSGVWKMRNFAFGKLQIVEDDELASAVKVSDAQKYGIITVRIIRVKANRRATPVRPTKYQPSGNIRQVSEKVLKGRDIQSSVTYINEHTIKEPSPHIYVYTKLAGQKGEKFLFNFHYRSTTALQALGLIPPGPVSPLLIQDEPLAEESRVANFGKEEREAIKPFALRDEVRPTQQTFKTELKDLEGPTPPLVIQSDPQVRHGSSEHPSMNRSETVQQRQAILAELARLEDVRTQRLLGELARLDDLEKQQKMIGKPLSQDNQVMDHSRGDGTTATGLKREHEDKVYIKKEGETKPKRAKVLGPVVTIDLTDD